MEIEDFPSNHMHKKPKRVSFWVAVILGIILVGSVFVNMLLFIGLVMKFSPESVTSQRELQYYEKPVSGTGKDKIVMLPINGIILSGSHANFWGIRQEGMAETITQMLKQAKEDEDVKAILLDIDSPGGGITACDIIHKELLKFKESGKKIVACMEDVAASGGYYISAPADMIIAHPTTVTGSIGVIMQLANIEGLYQKIGFRDVTIKSAEKKDIGSPTRPMTEEERVLLQGIIGEMHARFTEIVDDGRENLDIEEVRKLADGSIYTGTQAKLNGLVDEIGYIDDAIETAKKISNVKEARVIRYEKPFTIRDIFKIVSSRLIIGNPAININMGNLLKDGTPRIMYLWSP